MESEDPDEMVVSTITIVRVLTVEHGLCDTVEAVDRNGDDIPLTEALGILRLAEDTLIREAMGDD